MLDLSVAFVVAVAASALVGMAALRLAGAQRDSFAALPVGLAVMICVAAPALRVPGRAETVGILLAALMVVSAVIICQTGRIRNRWWTALGLLIPLVYVAVPFIVYGRTGILGVSLNNDMASHLLATDAFRSEQIFAVQGMSPSYPVGPHALVAAIAAPLGLDTASAFTGFTAAAALILCASALACLRRPTLLGASLAGALSLPFLAAAFYAQGSYKEMIVGALLIASAALLLPWLRPVGRLRWVPQGVLFAGALATYSYNAALWFGGLWGLWLAVEATSLVQRWGPARGIRVGLSRLTGELGSLAAGGVVFGLFVASQVPRIAASLRETGGGMSIPGSPLGNLAGRLPFWESTVTWRSLDYRYPPADFATASAVAGAILMLTVIGVRWWWRRGDTAVPLLALVATIAWAYIDGRHLPYLAAKALTLLAPVLALLIARPFAERDGWLGGGGGQSRVDRVGGVLLAVAIGVAATGSSLVAVASARLGSLDHAREIRTFAPDIGRRSVLFLGNDDFLHWILPLATVRAASVGSPDVPTRPEKAFDYGQAIDVDSIPTDVLNGVDFLITPRDPAASSLPPQFRRVRLTHDYALFRRAAPVVARVLLPEGQDAYAVLDCASEAGKRIVQFGGLAAVRGGQIGVAGPTLSPGQSASVVLPLPAGRWLLSVQYTSGFPVKLSVGGGTGRTLPPNLDRPGPRYWGGAVTTTRPRRVRVTFDVGSAWFSGKAAGFAAPAVIAVQARPDRLVPVRRACGKPVDYLLPDPG